MKKINLLIFSIILSCLVSCKENNPDKKDIENNEVIETSLGEANVNAKNLTVDFKNWWNYHSRNIAIESDFNAISETSKEITKLDFLENLATGKFIPVKLKSDGDEKYYKLFKLSNQADKSIRSTIKNTSCLVLNHFKMEGKLFPDFNFVDLEGKKYDNQNSFGKTTVVKYWFINCKACVEEFPMLNKFVEKHKGDNNIQFISLAFENKKDLKNLSKKNHFLMP